MTPPQQKPTTTTKSRPANTARPSEKDFTAGGIHTLEEKPRNSTGNINLDDELRQLASLWAQDPRTRDLVAGLMMTSLKIGRDNTGMADLKLMHRALREMRYASKVFKPYCEVRKVTIFGSARTEQDHPASLAAREFAQRMVEENFMVITGAGDGIMGAAQLGAGREQSFGLNIKLPFEQSANDTIVGDNKLITFNYFFTRKLYLVKEADAFVLFPGGFGTMDELFESITLIQTGKANILPVVLVDTPGGHYWHTFLKMVNTELLGNGLISPDDLHLMHITDNIEDAVQHITHFYLKFHSYRYVKNTTVFRLKKPLSEKALSHLNSEFADLLDSDQFHQGPALPEEANEPDIAHLPRLIANMKRNHYGRWRLLINAINHADSP